MSPGNTNYIVQVNEFEFSFNAEESASADLIKNPDASYNLIINNHSVHATILEHDQLTKHLVTEVDGEIFQVSIKDELDQVIDQMGFNTVFKKQIKEIKAPMPGLVLEISVSEGQELKEGDKVLILEAMKMENSIMMHTDARIKKIVVKTGQAVEKGQVLAELE